MSFKWARGRHLYWTLTVDQVRKTEKSSPSLGIKTIRAGEMNQQEKYMLHDNPNSISGLTKYKEKTDSLWLFSNLHTSWGTKMPQKHIHAHKILLIHFFLGGVGFLRQGFSVKQFWLSWNLLYRPS